MKKKFVFILIAFCICKLSSAEEKVGEYYMSYFNKSYDIEASAVKNGSFDFYIYTHPAEMSQRIGFSLRSSSVENFKSYFDNIKTKFVEWSQTAKDNNVTGFDKDFDCERMPVYVFFNYGSKWHFCYKNINPYFKVTDSGECLIVIHVGKITASDNKYIDSEGFYMAFTSTNELDDFLNSLDVKKILQKDEEKESINDLFK